MVKLDPRLRLALDQAAAAPAAPLVEAVAFVSGASAQPAAASLVEVLVRGNAQQPHDELRERLTQAGMHVRSMTGGPAPVFAGAIALDRLAALEQTAGIAQVEASRPLALDMDLALTESRTAPVQQQPGELRGRGVLIGVVDTGIDYTHPDFRRPDGSSRISKLWDQAAASGGTTPQPYGYGREYSQANLDAALALADPFTRVPHRDDQWSGHGTHVAGIAAGNGRASNGRFTGVAPEAELMVVALELEAGRTLGRSVRAVDAVAYLVEQAGGRPLVINLSQGMNSGGHAGETLLEAALDDYARRPNVVIVKSAGNEQQQNIHAGGTLRSGETTELLLEAQPGNRFDDIVEIWFADSDTISVAVQPPGEAPLAFVASGGELRRTTASGTLVQLTSDTNAENSGATRVTLILTPDTAAAIQPGSWRLLLRADSITAGRYDAWIERANRSVPGEQTRFADTSSDPSRTVTIPGTARRIITVGSYVIRPAINAAGRTGEIAPTSSRGPTRINTLKPELAAPGQEIIGPRAANSTRLGEFTNDRYVRMFGTSMAAPHVAGAAALLLERRPGLTCAQVRQVLMRSARRDGAASGAANPTWGAGKLDVARAVELLADAVFPQVMNVRVVGATISWQTDIPTNGRLRLHRHAGQLLLGSAELERTTPAATTHSVRLTDLTAGTYACEINATSAQGWSTLDDNAGAGYHVEAGQAGDAVTPPETTQPPARLTISGLQVEVIDATGGQSQVSVEFNVPHGSTTERTFYTQVLAHENGTTSVLATTSGTLAPNATSGKAVLICSPPAGGQHLVSTVLLPATAHDAGLAAARFAP